MHYRQKYLNLLLAVCFVFVGCSDNLVDVTVTVRSTEMVVVLEETAVSSLPTSTPQPKQPRPPPPYPQPSPQHAHQSSPRQHQIRHTNSPTGPQNAPTNSSQPSSNILIPLIGNNAGIMIPAIMIHFVTLHQLNQKHSTAFQMLRWLLAGVGSMPTI